MLTGERSQRVVKHLCVVHLFPMGLRCNWQDMDSPCAKLDDRVLPSKDSKGFECRPGLTVQGALLLHERNLLSFVLDVSRFSPTAGSLGVSDRVGSRLGFDWGPEVCKVWPV